MRGYRGFLRELSRTGSPRALVLQVRTGLVHLVRHATGRRPTDGVARFLDNYAPDGIRPTSPADRDLRLRSEACLVCGLCSAECARVGGRPALDPRDAVIAASRLEVDLLRFELGAELSGSESPCSGCAACDRLCPAGIPIHRVQERLGRLARLSWPAAATGGAEGNSRPPRESAKSATR